MSKVFGFAQITIHDGDRYKVYEENFMDILTRHGGRLTGFAEPPDVVEGSFEATRAVLLEFDTREAFDAWYGSEAYQDIIGHRLASSDGSVVVLNSHD